MINDKLDDLAAEIDSISGVCYLLCFALECHAVADDVMFNAISSMAEHLKRISDDIDQISIEGIRG